MNELAALGHQFFHHSLHQLLLLVQLGFELLDRVVLDMALLI